ncbi:GGDEF domain-containing protein [Actinoplanes sp. NEAU-A12]|uniref:GGDEF domain-containing protein n=1 Tax=Actinoplanes sandaracinus TaxID=3045177 RepID=A0ABT6WKT9_9ACTN|nr:GGDEF domain-containing protein [Actinoplanes sandaracinus]MDI6100333.1 GGDEF domain-containing protein [Actinoplanes sandaracinus]
MLTDTAVGHRAPAPFDAAAIDAELDELRERVGSDIDVALPRAAELERRAEVLGEPALRWRCTLLRADMTERRGDLGTAMRLAWQAREWAAAANCRRVLSHAHELLARLYRVTGDVLAHLDHMMQAVGAMDDTVPSGPRISCMVKLADAYAETGSLAASRERYEEALRAAVAAGDLRRQAMAFNNWAYSEYDYGDMRLAREVIGRMVELSRQGWELDYCDYDTIARVELGLGNHGEAERAARAALAAYETDATDESDAVAELTLTLATVQRHQGNLTAATESLEISRTLCDEVGLGLLAVRVQREAAELHAAKGDFEQAYRALDASVAAEKRLSSRQREAQARNQQAVFEVSEARRLAETFRDQARRDALTGLSNRRFVDETLPPLLARAAADGTPVTAALLDLDHFKRINDTLSHEVGDRVLAEFARLLTRAAGGNGIAARFGGEEFLLVLTGLPRATATARMEHLRRAVADHDWAPITGDRRVTVSVGVTMAGPDSTAASLLSRADEALYEAKRAGRDRVHLDVKCRWRGMRDVPE